MSSTVVSKNLYELLGNDHDEDSDKEPEPPVKVIDKTPARNTKRNAPAEAPASSAPASGNARGGRRGGGFSGNDGAFRDRNAGRANNQGKPTDENGQQDRAPRAEGTYRGRGGGGRGRGNFDRHSRGVGGESEKQANHGWGAPEGGAELADEVAGEAIAKADETEALTGDAEGGPEVVAAPEPEPEDNSISYSDYLAQQAEKKLALGTLEIRKPSEGKLDKKWANAKALSKEEEEDFVAASAGKAKRERERVAKKTHVDIDQRFVEPAETRGGRGGGGRGGRGRGDGQSRGRGEGFRGGRGDRGGGERRPRGDGQSFRGGRGGGGQGQGGQRNNAAASLNTEDPNAFPSLGA